MMQVPPLPPPPSLSPPCVGWTFANRPPIFGAFLPQNEDDQQGGSREVGTVRQYPNRHVLICKAAAVVPALLPSSRSSLRGALMKGRLAAEMSVKSAAGQCRRWRRRWRQQPADFPRAESRKGHTCQRGCQRAFGNGEIIEPPRSGELIGGKQRRHIMATLLRPAKERDFFAVRGRGCQVRDVSKPS